MTNSRPFAALLFVAAIGVSGCPEEAPSTDVVGGDADVINVSSDVAWSPVVEDYDPGALLSIWSNGPDNVWVVGGEEGEAVVLHLDGTSWTRHDSGLDDQVWWVHGFDDGTVFVAGALGGISRYANGVWEVMDSGAPGTTFYGIWGAAPDDMWAVGGPVLFPPTGVEAEGDVIVHYDGESWSRVTVEFLEDKPESAQKNLFKVWGANATNVFIVGDSGLALHYDGTDWNRVETPATGITLFTVTGRAADDVWAIGGLSGSILIHWDGTEWTQVLMTADAPTLTQGIWTAPGHPLIISGMSGYTGVLDADGNWHEPESITNDTYHAVFGDGAGGLFACGGNIVALLPDHHGVLSVSGRTVPAFDSLPPASSDASGDASSTDSAD